MKTKRGVVLSSLLTICSALATGCATTATPENTKALKVDAVPGMVLDGRDYRNVTVMPFQIGENVTKAESQFGENFSGDIAARLRADYTGLFEQIRWNKPRGEDGEVIVTGTIHKYIPGSAELRGLLIGLGPSSFEGELILKDATVGRVLLRAPFDKLWAWGGQLGASKSIDNMVADTSVAIAKTVALWKQGKLLITKP
jgi:hypothetical protein